METKDKKNSENNSVIKVTGKVINVVMSDTLKRVGIVLDKTFKGFNQNDEEIETDTFRFNLYTAAKQFAPFILQVKMAQALSLGKPIQPELLALVLTNANITIERTLREKGEQRDTDDENDVFEKDTWTTKVVACTPNIDPSFAPMIAEYIKPAPKASQTININPFAV